MRLLDILGPLSPVCGYGGTYHYKPTELRHKQFSSTVAIARSFLFQYLSSVGFAALTDIDHIVEPSYSLLGFEPTDGGLSSSKLILYERNTY